jgi:hypothetical protein
MRRKTTTRAGTTTKLRSAPVSAAPLGPAPFVPPYPPSWLNRLIAWIDRRPGPAWAYYAAAVFLSGTILIVAQWLLGSIQLETLVFSVDPIYFVALAHYLDRQARSSLERFRPALGASATEYARIEYELTTVPARGAWIATALAIPLGVSFILGGKPDPLSLQVLSANLVALVFTAFATASFFVLGLLTLRQLRTVSKLHASAPTINLLQPRPTYAFSRLTSRTALGVVLFLYFDFLVNPPTAGASLPYFALAGLALVLMAAAFLLPLLGMHQRLETEKARLEAEVNLGVEIAYRELQEHVRSKSYTQVDQLEKALTGLLRMREVVSRLSTWPWQPETLRGLLAAVALPIAVWLIQFGLQRLLG